MSLRGGRDFNRVTGNKWVREPKGRRALLVPGPILIGPPPRRSWKRIAAGGAETTQLDVCADTIEVPLVEVDETKVEAQCVAPISAKAQPSIKPVMKRFGSNKLVLKKSPPAPVLEVPEKDSRMSPTNVASSSFCENQPARMKPKGRNKLVSQNRLDEERQLKQNLKRKRIDAREAVEIAGLKHKGRNKLVSETLAEQEEERLKEALKQRHMESQRNRKSGPVKRIKLLQDDNEEAEAKLTDFAYQTTSKSKFRSMGLVRIAPDNSAPVCPTFSRGMLCTNPTCTKRHDVSLESATPVCSFFQRHGQCLKRDTCPFRHIKVNPHATVCEQFTRLGYCEDQDCKLRHVRERK